MEILPIYIIIFSNNFEEKKNKLNTGPIIAAVQ
jgi:hypothetical protein